MQRIIKDASSKGCTTLHDCAIGAIDPELDYTTILELVDDDPPMRISGFLTSSDWDYWQNKQEFP